MVYIDLEDETECFDSVKLYDGKNIRIGTIKKKPQGIVRIQHFHFLQKDFGFCDIHSICPDRD